MGFEGREDSLRKEGAMKEDRGRQFEDSEERPLTEDEIGEWEVLEHAPSISRSAVLTVRFAPEELRRVRDAAKASGQSMAEVIRDAVEAYLSARSTVVSMGWSWSTGIGEAYVLGRSGLVTRGQGLQEEIEQRRA
jgi:hypothetical protein